MQLLFRLLELWDIPLGGPTGVNLMETNPFSNCLKVLFLQIKQQSQDCLKEFLVVK